MSHGMSQTRFYNIWRLMLQRCNNPNNPNYAKYGGSGIRACERWKEFENFKEDMHMDYLLHVQEYGEKQTTIDRISSKGHYEPGNCRWATRKVQRENTTRTLIKERIPRSFRFKGEVIDKLDKIREYHQEIIDSAFIKSDTLVISKTAVVEGMIEQEYFKMVQDGLIKDE